MSSGGCELWFGAECGSDDGERFAGDVALEDPQRVVATVASCASPFRELAGPGIVDHPVVGDRPQRVVGGTVATAVQAVSARLPAGGLDWADTAERREGRVTVEPLGVFLRL